MKIKYLVISLILIISGCSNTTPSTNIIMFDNHYYAPTRSLELKIYDSRLEIPKKYYEIGTIKYEGMVSEQEIKNIAAEKGAMAIVKDDNNYVLIRYYTDKMEKGNANKKS